MVYVEGGILSPQAIFLHTILNETKMQQARS